MSEQHQLNGTDQESKLEEVTTCNLRLKTSFWWIFTNFQMFSTLKTS